MIYGNQEKWDSMPADEWPEMLSWPADTDPVADRDDSLALLFLCCHPALTQASRIALTLRAVGGLTTAQIAAAFLVPEATTAQRISRAKQTIAGLSPGRPPPRLIVPAGRCPHPLITCAGRLTVAAERPRRIAAAGRSSDRKISKTVLIQD